MFADDLRRDFYLKIKGKRVLIIVNYDVDAICACKILQSLFKTDYTLYTLVPVDLYSDLESAYEENHLDEKYIIFINCGGTIDLVEVLKPDEDITFFVIDSHRPIDVCNVYSTSQVVLLSKVDPSESIPDFDEIFRDDSDDEEEDSENENQSDGDIEGEVQRAKKRRLNDEDDDALRKSDEKKAWAKRRQKLMAEYMEFTYYGRSSALTMYELAWKLSKDSFDLLWYGIVGLSEQLLMRKIDEKTYITECGDVQNHVARLTHRSSQLVDEGRNTAMRIDFDKDLRLAIYRHWTVKSSLTYSVLPATRLKLWTFKGQKRLHEMLAEIGIPLTQCNQKYCSMDLVFRKEFYESIVKMSDKYDLDGIVYVSFLMQHGFRGKYSASDFVYGLLALLQSTSNEKSKTDCFLDCLEALSRVKKDKLDQGIELAKNMFMLIFKQVQSALETSAKKNAVKSRGSFLELSLDKEGADSTICRHPYGILLLAEFALKAYVAKTKVRRGDQNPKGLPLIVVTPYKTCKEKANDEDKEEDLCTVIGVAPLAVDSNKNLLGRAFEVAAQELKINIHDSYFDSSVILLSQDKCEIFLNHLAGLLR